MTCAKKQVECLIISDGAIIGVGENNCATPQETCPRKLGEDYAKCKSICHQFGHAEIMALKNVHDNGFSHNLKGSEAFLEGIGWYCRDCQEKLFAAGVTALKLVK